MIQEHGRIGRVIIIYRQCIRNMEDGVDFDHALLVDAGSIVGHVIHGDHELEEAQIRFPILARRQELAKLVSALVGQHQAARGLT